MILSIYETFNINKSIFIIKLRIKDKMNLDFLGDVYLDKQYSIDLKLENFIFNLEYPLSTKGIPAKNKVNLGEDISYILDTFKKNPYAVNLSNNHIMDYGETGFNDTIKFLEETGIKYFGAGKKSNNYNNPLIVKSNNKNLALLAYCCPSAHGVYGNENHIGAATLNINKIKVCFVGWVFLK